MRDFGIVTLLSVVATAAAPTPPAPNAVAYGIIQCSQSVGHARSGALLPLSTVTKDEG